MSRRLLALLDLTREEIGSPLVVTSGWRDPDRNVAAGGATDSSHLTGEGVDGYIIGLPLLAAFAHLSRYAFSGLGLYPDTEPPTFHVDVKWRGRRALWVRRDVDGKKRYLYAPAQEFYDAFLAV